MVSLIIDVCMCVCVWCMHACMCVWILWRKHFLSKFQSQNSYFLYISNDKSEDDYYSETAGDYVLNALLVIVASPG